MSKESRARIRALEEGLRVLRGRAAADYRALEALVRSVEDRVTYLENARTPKAPTAGWTGRLAEDDLRAARAEVERFQRIAGDAPHRAGE